jgi:hypothetical protein
MGFSAKDGAMVNLKASRLLSRQIDYSNVSLAILI